MPSTAIARVIGRGGCNINAIREFTGAHIDIDKQKDKAGDRMITIRYFTHFTSILVTSAAKGRQRLCFHHCLSVCL